MTNKIKKLYNSLMIFIAGRTFREPSTIGGEVVPEEGVVKVTPSVELQCRL